MSEKGKGTPAAPHRRTQNKEKNEHEMCRCLLSHWVTTNTKDTAAQSRPTEQRGTSNGSARLVLYLFDLIMYVVGLWSDLCA